MCHRKPGIAAPAILVGLAACMILTGPVRGNDLEADLETLLRTPNKQNYLKVFQQVVSHPKYNPYSKDLDKLAELVDKGQFQQAQAKFDESMPNLLLSPRAHLLASLTAERLGDGDEARHEQLLGEKCLEGIVSSGDGSAKAPYLVSRVSDEYDVLRYLRKKMRFQEFLRVEGKRLDALSCTDDTKVHFDVTAAFEALNRKIRKP